MKNRITKYSGLLIFITLLAIGLAACGSIAHTTDQISLSLSELAGDDWR
jgi:hypothetical protein